jgi:hypothetical protein
MMWCFVAGSADVSNVHQSPVKKCANWRRTKPDSQRQLSTCSRVQYDGWPDGRADPARETAPAWSGTVTKEQKSLI